MHPLDDLPKWLSNTDFAILDHRFAQHGRDYLVFIETSTGPDKGQHEIIFSHCVRADYETRVMDVSWPPSWGNEFIDYREWIRAGKPDGYVWGTNCCFPHPRFEAIRDSALAAEWTRRLGKEMYEISLQTDMFFLRLIFHSIRSRKLHDRIEITDEGVFPLK